MLPPAPVTFSTTTVWPRPLVMRSAMMRAMVSVGPPAENGTTMLSGRVGKFCAPAAPQQKASADARSRSLLEANGLPVPAGIARAAVAAVELPDELRAAELVVVVDRDDAMAAAFEL